MFISLVPSMWWTLHTNLMFLFIYIHLYVCITYMCIHTNIQIFRWKYGGFEWLLDFAKLDIWLSNLNTFGSKFQIPLTTPCCLTRLLSHNNSLIVKTNFAELTLIFYYFIQKMIYIYRIDIKYCDLCTSESIIFPLPQSTLPTAQYKHLHSV